MVVIRISIKNLLSSQPPCLSSLLWAFIYPFIERERTPATFITHLTSIKRSCNTSCSWRALGLVCECPGPWKRRGWQWAVRRAATRDGLCGTHAQRSPPRPCGATGASLGLPHVFSLKENWEPTLTACSLLLSAPCLLPDAFCSATAFIPYSIFCIPYSEPSRPGAVESGEVHGLITRAPRQKNPSPSPPFAQGLWHSSCLTAVKPIPNMHSERSNPLSPKANSGGTNPWENLGFLNRCIFYFLLSLLLSEPFAVYLLSLYPSPCGSSPRCIAGALSPRRFICFQRSVSQKEL